MAIELSAEGPLLRDDGSGALRIGNTRVLFELVIRAFQDGATPEAIAQRYPTVSLAEVYSSIAYYLRHRDDVERYLAERELQAEQTRENIKARQGDLAEVRSRMLANSNV